MDFFFKFKITGVKEIQKLLKEIDTKHSKKVIKKATRNGMKTVAKTAKRKVPKKSGDYRRALTTKAMRPKKNRIGYRLFVDTSKLRDGADKEFYPSYIEHGWEGVPAKAPLRKTYLMLQKIVAKQIQDEILEGLRNAKAIN